MADNRVLQNELDTRTTGDGDIFEMLELLEQRNKALRSRLKGELTVADNRSDVRSKGAPTPELSEFDALALGIGQELLKRHAGDAEATRRSVMTLIGIIAAGNQFGHYVQKLLEALDAKTDALVVHEGQLMMQSHLNAQRTKEEVTAALSALVDAVFYGGRRPSGNAAHVAAEAVKAVDRLRTDATALSDGEAVVATLLTKLGKLVSVNRDKNWDNNQFEAAVADAIQRKIAASGEEPFLRELPVSPVWHRKRTRVS